MGKKGFLSWLGFGKNKQEENEAEIQRLEEEALAKEAEEKAEAEAQAQKEAEEKAAAEAQAQKEAEEKAEAEALAEKEAAEPKKKEGFFSKLFKGLEKTRKGIMSQIDSMLKGYGKIDEELFEELEEMLIMADVGAPTTERIIENLKAKIKEEKITEAMAIKDLLKNELTQILTENELGNQLDLKPSPAIVLVVGVNGVGKTTTIGKLAAKLTREGNKVLLAAGDTFRAAAIEQLTEWSKRAQVDIIAHKEGADSSAVIFDAIQASKARGVDVLICDTAGRLHNKKNLMNELNKIFRVVEREYPQAKKEVLLVVDATTGQNAIVQAKAFKEVCDLTGIVLTKLDGTAKGGVVLAVQSEVNVPVKLVTVGEKIDDLQDFEPISFVNAIFE